MTMEDGMRPAAPPKLTYADYVALPDDDRRHELIDGAHSVTPSPATRHQRVLRRLAFALQNWLEEHPGGEMFFGPLDVVLSDVDVVVPDLFFVARDRLSIVDARGIRGAPDLVVEVVSPGTRRRDAVIKRGLYERAGVCEYWIVDPEGSSVTVHRRAGDRFAPAVELLGTNTLTTPLLPGWRLAVAALVA